MKYTMISSLILLTISTSAYALNFNTPITNLKGEVIHQCAAKRDNQSAEDYKKECDNSAPLKLSDVAINALVAEYADEQPNPREGKTGLSGLDKFKRTALAINIQGSKDGNVDLSPEQTTMLKDLIGKAYSGPIIYRSWEILDPSLKTK